MSNILLLRTNKRSYSPMPGQSQPSCVNLIFHLLAKAVARVAAIVIVMGVFPLKSTKMVWPVLSPHSIGTTVLPPVMLTESVVHTPSPSGWASTRSRKSIRSCMMQNYWWSDIFKFMSGLADTPGFQCMGLSKYVITQLYPRPHQINVY